MAVEHRVLKSEGSTSRAVAAVEPVATVENESNDGLADKGTKTDQNFILCYSQLYHEQQGAGCDDKNAHCLAHNRSREYRRYKNIRPEWLRIATVTYFDL